jgi:hypothetical protein
VYHPFETHYYYDQFTMVGPYPVDPRKMVNQQWVLIAASTKALSASFFPLIALLPQLQCRCLEMTKHILVLYPDTNFGVLLCLLVFILCPKCEHSKTQFLCFPIHISSLLHGALVGVASPWLPC